MWSRSLLFLRHAASEAPIPQPSNVTIYILSAVETRAEVYAADWTGAVLPLPLPQDLGSDVVCPLR